MNKEIVPHKTPRALARQGLRLPAIIDDAGENAQRKFVEFFVARIRNKNTRSAYLRRAAIYEHLGEFEKAIDYYTRLVELWKDADPELQPYVEEARAQIDRLVKTRAREPQT